MRVSCAKNWTILTVSPSQNAHFWVLPSEYSKMARDIKKSALLKGPIFFKFSAPFCWTFADFEGIIAGGGYADEVAKIILLSN